MNLLEWALKQERNNELTEDGKIPTKQELSRIMRSGDESLISKTWEDIEMAGGYAALLDVPERDEEDGKVVYF